MTLPKPWPWIALVVAGGLILLGLDRWTTREANWKKELAAQAEAARVRDSVREVHYAEQRHNDSLRQAALKARGDSAQRSADQEARHHVVLARRLDSAEAALDSAKTLADTAAQRGMIIEAQRAVIAGDQVEKGELRATIAARDAQLADTSALQHAHEALAGARADLAKLIDKAGHPPKEFRILGLRLALDPYVGVGVNVSPKGAVNLGLQGGLSLFHR